MARLTKEEKRFVEQIEEEIRYIKMPSVPEREELFKAAEGGDDEAIRRLVEIMTPEVLEIAMEKHLEGLHIGDLIQEGYIALFEAFGELGKKEAQTYDAYLHLAIREGMEKYILETATELKGARDIAEKLNLLMEAAETLIEEYGEVTMADVANYTKLSADEIEELLRIAGEEGLFGETEDDK